MTAVLLWKEYRQQRAYWLAIALLAMLLLVVLTLTLGHGTIWESFHEKEVGNGLVVVLYGLIVTYGVVSPALLLAGEKEDGTMPFLDNLTGRRSPVFLRKVLAGLLFVLSLSLFFAALAIPLCSADWLHLLILPLVGFEALMVGLLAGAICRKVLIASALGIAFLVASTPVAYVLAIPFFGIAALFGLGIREDEIGWVLIPAKAVEYGMLFWLAKRTYCSDDFKRTLRGQRKGSKRLSSLFQSWQALVWLSIRQGRWLMLAAITIVLLTGATVLFSPFVVWPIGSLALGLVCGLTSFSGDQPNGQRFLGSQRLPPGKIWTIKLLFWFAFLCALISLAGFAALVANIANRAFEAHAFRPFEFYWIDRVQFFGLWPLYGFCFGQFFGQVMQRPLLADMLAMFLTPLLAALWMPSLLLGGLSYWQVLLTPVILLLITRFAQWPSECGCLTGGRPLASLIGGVVLLAVSSVGCLWYRAVEIPDIGEPFDVKAFAASLPSPEMNEAGPAIRRAGLAMRKLQADIEGLLPPPKKPVFQNDNAQAKPVPQQPSRYSYRELCVDVRSNGWPIEDEQIGEYLDKIFEGDWAKDAQTAAKMPLGMLYDPRLLDSTTEVWETVGDCDSMTVLFELRAMQLQLRGELRDALNIFETVLALSRQARNAASQDLLYCSMRMERSALTEFRFWLNNAISDKELLRDGLAMLRRHEAELPGPEQVFKAQYLIYRNSEASEAFATVDEPIVLTLLRAAREVPWEKDRWRRISQLIVSTQIWKAHLPCWETEPPNWKGAYFDSRFPHAASLSRFSKEQWNELQSQARSYQAHLLYFVDPLGYLAKNLQILHASEVVTAIVSYQADHGRPPEDLDDLVPTYLSVLPNDPLTGRYFEYRVSVGEMINIDRTLQFIAPGQAYIRSQKPVWTGGPSALVFPVPFRPPQEKQS